MSEKYSISGKENLISCFRGVPLLTSVFSILLLVGNLGILQLLGSLDGLQLGLLLVPVLHSRRWLLQMRVQQLQPGNNEKED